MSIKKIEGRHTEPVLSLYYVFRWRNQRISNAGLCCLLCCLSEQIDGGDLRPHGVHVTLLQRSYIFCWTDNVIRNGRRNLAKSRGTWSVVMRRYPDILSLLRVTIKLYISGQSCLLQSVYNCVSVAIHKTWLSDFRGSYVFLHQTTDATETKLPTFCRNAFYGMEIIVSGFKFRWSLLLRVNTINQH